MGEFPGGPLRRHPDQVRSDLWDGRSTTCSSTTETSPTAASYGPASGHLVIVPFSDNNYDAAPSRKVEAYSWTS